HTAARAGAGVIGRPGHTPAMAAHPLAARTPSQVGQVAAAAGARIAAGPSPPSAPPAGESVRSRVISKPAPARAGRRQITGDFAGVNRVLEDEGWTDGLPVIPPTEALVDEMLRGATRPADEILGRMEPLQGTVT